MKALIKNVDEINFSYRGTDQDKVFKYLTSKRVNTQVVTSMDAFERMYPFFNFGVFTIHNERFFALLLNAEGKQVGVVKVSSFAQPFVNIDLNLLLKEATACSAVNIVVAHNSITNNTQPTKQDDYFTQLLQQECSNNQLVLHDHLIVSEYGKYYSYADEQICKRCEGTGYFHQYSHIKHGVCFDCWGSGNYYTEEPNWV
jgi:DNA repair protein RadC